MECNYDEPSPRKRNAERDYFSLHVLGSSPYLQAQEYERNEAERTT